MPRVEFPHDVEELRKEVNELEGRLALMRRMLDGAEAQIAYYKLIHGSDAAPAPQEDEVAEDEPLTDAVEKVVREMATPVSPGVIRSVLSQNPKHQPRLERSPTYLYSVLFRLVKQGRLRKVGDRYTAPRATSEISP